MNETNEQEPVVAQLGDEKGKREIKPKDPVFKLMLQEYLQGRGVGDAFEIIAGKQVGQLQLEIDTAIIAKIAQLPEAILQQTPFWFLKRHNFVEFKGVDDPLNEKKFTRILGRAFLGHGDVPSDQQREVVSCIITDAVPQKLFKTLRERGTNFKPIKGLPGYYLHKGILFPIYLIVCNRLPITPLYYPLLMFASGKQLTNYFEQLALDTGMEFFLKYIVRMYPKEGAKLYEKVGDIMLTAEDQRYIADVLGEVLPPEEKLRLFRGDEELVKIVVKDSLEELDSQALVQIISDVKQLSPEKIAALKRLLSDENETL